MRAALVTRLLLVLAVVLSVIVRAFRVYRAARSYNDPTNDAEQPPNLDAYYLVLVPTKTPWWACWTLVTTCLVELQLIPFIVFLVLVGTGGRYCEKAWTTKPYLIFVAMFLLGPNIVELMLCLLTKSSSSISGANGLASGLTVALKQLIPGHTIILMRGRIRIQLRWLPTLFLVFVTALWAVDLDKNLLSSCLGFVGSWFFLRFYQNVDAVSTAQSTSPLDVHGDASDAFEFARFFPQPLSSWIEGPLDKVYHVAVRFHVVPFLTPEQIDIANQKYGARLSGHLLPIFARGVQTTNERRRMMLRTLID